MKIKLELRKTFNLKTETNEYSKHFLDFSSSKDFDAGIEVKWRLEVISSPQL